MTKFPAYQIDYVISALEHECRDYVVEFRFDEEATSARAAIADWLAGEFLDDLLERVRLAAADAMPDEDAEDNRTTIEVEAIRHFALDVKSMLQHRLSSMADTIREGHVIEGLDLTDAYVEAATYTWEQACSYEREDRPRGVREPIVDDLILSLRTNY